MKRKPNLDTHLDPAIERLKALAAEASDALLTEGPVHPDHQLLDLCAEIAHARKTADAAFRHWCDNKHVAAWQCKTEEEKTDLAEREQARDQSGARYSHLLRRAAKLTATTPAGIYAKAIAVRSSQTGAKFLAMSLAADLLNCQVLRESLWPADPEGV